MMSVAPFLLALLVVVANCSHLPTGQAAELPAKRSLVDKEIFHRKTSPLHVKLTTGLMGLRSKLTKMLWQYDSEVCNPELSVSTMQMCLDWVGAVEKGSIATRGLRTAASFIPGAGEITEVADAVTNGVEGFQEVIRLTCT